MRSIINQYKLVSDEISRQAGKQFDSLILFRMYKALRERVAYRILTLSKTCIDWHFRSHLGRSHENNKST